MNEEVFKKMNSKLDLIISILERQKDTPEVLKKSSSKQEKSYSGVGGGLRFLVDQGFFNKKRAFPEIIEELKVKTYHYPRTSVQPILISMSKPGGPLVRIKEAKKYYYVIRR